MDCYLESLKGEEMIKTEQERIFRRAMRLKTGEEIEINFDKESELNSFRVLLYNVRKKLQEYSVLITKKDEKTLVLKKGFKIKVSVKKIDGKKNIVSSSVEDERMKAFEKEKEEILKEGSEMGWSLEMINELLSAAMERITEEITVGKEIEEG